MTPLVRTEQASDTATIRRVHELAFGQRGEADLVDALRGSEARLPELSLVADDSSQAVGHVLFSLVRLDSGHSLLSLGPMAVLPARQREGIGTLLVHRGLELASQTDYPLIVVVGHPNYYPRFGFVPARPLELESPYDVPDEAWMAFKLPAWSDAIGGTVRYPAAWSGL